MKKLTIIISLLSIFSFQLFSNGIGIIDGSAGLYLQVMESKTSIVVQDQIAIITCTEILKNVSSSATTFKYAFPLKEYSNPTSIRWKYKNEWKTAILSSNTQDNSIPSSGGGGSGIDPALEEYLGEFPLFFTPNDEVGFDEVIVMEVTYVELLPYYLGRVSFYQKSNISQMQGNPVISKSLDFTLFSEREVLDLDLAGLEADIDIQPGVSTLTFNLDEQLSDYDFEIEYELASDDIGINSLSTFIPDSTFQCDEEGSGFFSFIIEPESNVNTEVIEKNFSLIIDRSGSMKGNKIIQAKDAASYIVQNLNLGDFFNIIDFSSNVKSLSDEFLEYNLTHENLALEYVEDIAASGSTNISEALTQAISDFDVVQEDKANIIIFFTDGQATAGMTGTNQILNIVENEVTLSETEIFLFTVGIGQDVDKALLTLLANNQNGLVKFIEPDNLEVELVEFFLSINNPVLLNTSITVDPPVITEIYPDPTPNLYKGQQAIISGRYTTPEDVKITLTGNAFNVPVEYEFDVSLADAPDVELSFLPKIWAKQKLDALELEFYQVGSQIEADSITTLIDSISLCYGVVALEFTSFEDGSTTEVDEVFYENEDVVVYPNPCYDKLRITIKTLKGDEKGVIKILNAQAETVYSSPITFTGKTLFIDDLEQLPSGIYFALVTIEGKNYMVRFSKL